MIIELRALGISIAVFATLFVLLSLVAHGFEDSISDLEKILPWLNLAAYLLYVVSGFVAGIVAKRREAINGMISGCLAAGIAIWVFGVTAGDMFGIAATFVNGAVLGTVGGAVAWYLARRKAHTK